MHVISRHDIQGVRISEAHVRDIAKTAWCPSKTSWKLWSLDGQASF